MTAMRSVQLHFEAAAARGVEVEVDEFWIEESFAQGFVARVEFRGAGALLFDEVAGIGAAISLRTAQMGERVWAGICSDLTLLDSAHEPGEPNTLRYRMVISSALHRLSLRTNSRIFQHMTTPDIVKKILGEWGMAVAEARLAETYAPHEFKVQYEETDLAFLTRLLEEAGITFWMEPAPAMPSEATPGAKLTRFILDDQPHQRRPRYPKPDGEPLYFSGDVPRDVADPEAHAWSLTASQHPISGRVTMRDHDFRARIDRVPSGSAVFGGPDALGEKRYERYHYEPGAFWDEGGKSVGETPVADDRGVARLLHDALTDVPKRRLAAELAQRTVAKFHTDALDIEPGVVFAIGKDDPLFLHNHPHPSFGPNVRLLVTARKLHGRQASYSSQCTAVFGASAYRPPLTVKRPRIFGVQSAVVVGPTGQEIHTDEFGRVRVQFDWDREGNFDNHSSCWIRVSQGWAGGGFGSVALPRVGHEVLVSFFEGNPDRPVVVGRVFNGATNTPYFPATGRDGFGANATKTAIRTDSSPHGAGRAGYNELLFQDERGHELVHVQAQRDLTFTVNAGESHAVGGDVSFSVGAGESHAIKRDLDYVVGGAESHMVTGEAFIKTGGRYSITANAEYYMMTHSSAGFVSFGAMSFATKATTDIEAEGRVAIRSNTAIELEAPSFSVTVNGASLVMDSNGVTIHTGGATMRLGQSNALLEGSAGTILRSGGPVTVAASGDTHIGGANVTIDGGEVLLNCDSAPTVILNDTTRPAAPSLQVVIPDATPMDDFRAGGHGETQGPPFLPQEVATPPEVPGPFEQVEVHAED